MTEAPFRGDLADGPEGGRAVWAEASDGVRVRVGLWPRDGDRGTAVIFPGRTEYIEKYGRVASDLSGAGFAAAAIDWRGQGLADRLLEDANIGHVLSFGDYQRDVAAMFRVLADEGFPRPYYLLAHSMGGCIGLRALIDGLAVERAAFSAPMWGISIRPALRPVAALLPWAARRFGRETDIVPGSSPVSYVFDRAFEENALTSDREHFEWFMRHAEAEPGFRLGGPSLHWLSEALRETRALLTCPRPTLPVLTYLGGREEIVDAEAIRRLHAGWSSARLVEIPAARHELLMEVAEIRSRVIAGVVDHFGA